jgi:peptidoglycan/LPS O-acetylase OafA/YrhL
VAGRPIIPPAWSLSHELKFYCWFALAIYLPARFSRWIIGSMAALSLGVFVLSLIPAASGLLEKLSPGNFAFFLIHPLNLEFVAGSLCAYILRRYSLRRGGIILGVGIGLFSIAAIFDNRYCFGDMWQILYYGVASAIVLLGAAAWNFQSSSFLFRHLVFLGEASYSLYLIHFPICALACVLMLKLGMIKTSGIGLAVILMLFIAVFTACLFHWLVERPVLKAAHRLLLKPEKKF